MAPQSSSSSSGGAQIGPGNGISFGYTGDNATILQAMLAFTAIAWYNAIELLVLIFMIFKKYSGLYFWSLLLTSFSVIPYSLGILPRDRRIVYPPG
jgi:hypothetical protein